MSTKKKTSTGLERQHVYRSFKERVDLLRIEPARQLRVRASDYVETSHFLATLEHWKEVNISANFTEFVAEVEPVCQSLAQILHHQQRIYDALERHVRVLDMNSVQPLLELTAQFVHDLGPEFMPFYDLFLGMVIDIAQNSNPNDAQNIKNTANVLEWTFNTLAHAFKYLARTLVADLQPTFERLLPVFSMSKKTYLARFGAEAVSFLVKKLKPEPLLRLVHAALHDNRALLVENAFYRDAMVILFSESLKNTQHTFHSKSSSLFATLLDAAFTAHTENDTCIDVLSDVLLAIVTHGSADSCAKFYSASLDHLCRVLADNASLKRVGYVCHVLTVLCFAESGAKICDWSCVFAAKHALRTNYDKLRDESAESRAVAAALACLYATMVRNCDVHVLTRHYASLAEYLVSLYDGEYFLSFYEFLMTNASEKILGFGATLTVQSIVSSASSPALLARASLFLANIEQQHPPIRDEIALPPVLTQKLLEMLSCDCVALEANADAPVGDAALLSLHWKLHLLEYAPGVTSAHEDARKVLLVLLDALAQKLPASLSFAHDVFGACLAAAVRSVDTSSPEATALYRIFRAQLPRCSQSVVFLTGSAALVRKLAAHSKNTLSADTPALVASLGSVLSAPDMRVRCAAAELVRVWFALLGESAPFVFRQVGVIDHVPLTVESANEVKMRIRMMFDEYAGDPARSASDHAHLANYVVGLLTNRFQPCWQAVNENIGKLGGDACFDAVWCCFRDKIGLQLAQQDASLFDQDPVWDAEQLFVGRFEPSNERFAKYIAAFSATVVTKASTEHALQRAASKNRPDTAYSSMIRTRILAALAAASDAAERNGAELIGLFLDRYIVDADWSSKDKNACMSIFTKFRHIQRIANSQRLYDAMLQHLSSKDTATQRLALSVLFVWNKAEISKYKDNLTNLLDDRLFRDELYSLVSKKSESIMADLDRAVVVPLVLRILYGRAKGCSSSRSKNGRKFAIASVLHNLPDGYIGMFLLLTAEHLKMTSNFEQNGVALPTSGDLRTMAGYLNMLYEVYVGLGYKYAHVLRDTIRPLLFSLISAQHVLTESDDADATVKSAKIVRQLGFKCLSHLFKVTCKTYDWKDEAQVVYQQVIQPRLAQFPAENAQQPSSMMQMMLSWVQARELVPLYYFDAYAPVHALVGLLANRFAKDVVRVAILDFAIACFTQRDVHDDRFYAVVAILVEGLLGLLPDIIGSSEDRDVSLRSATLLLLIVEGKYLDNSVTMAKFVLACSHALDKPPTQIGAEDKASLLISLAAVVDAYDCTFGDVSALYEACSRALRVYKDRNLRCALAKVFQAFGRRFSEVAETAALIAGLNAYSERRVTEPDFERRLTAFRALNEDAYARLTVRQWMPIVHVVLFFINDPEEISMRLNAAHTLTRYIDSMNGRDAVKDALEDAYAAFWRTTIAPHLRAGLKKDAEVVRDGYITVLAHAVRHCERLPELQSMRVLLSDDAEADFFANLGHMQLACRQEAVRQLDDHRNEISADCLYHYLIPMTEVYAFCPENRFVYLWNMVHEKWLTLTLCLHWRDFRQLFRKHIAAAARVTGRELRDRCRLVVSISRGLKLAFESAKLDVNCDRFRSMPDDPELVQKQIMDDLLAPIMTIVKVRDDDTIAMRVPMVEAAANCLACVSQSAAEVTIAGMLTSTCQALRSRTQHVRDAVRKALGRAARVLGARFFRYLVLELKTALVRGSQLHTLSYTVHALLVAVQDIFQHGDLDESAPLIVDIIMEDIFGAPGQEKDAEGYVSKMIEVKGHKSYDTAQMLTANISFDRFREIVDPLKLLMRESLPLRTKLHLDELVRRYAAGINFNAYAGTRDVLVLCYELLEQSMVAGEVAPQKRTTAAEEHFLVELHVRKPRMALDASQGMCVLQTLAYEVMRTALKLHAQLLTVDNLDGFVPLIEQTLTLQNEETLCALFRLLNMLVELPFAPERDQFFENATVKAFTVIQDLPTTDQPVFQIMLRYLAAIVLHKSTIKLNHTSLTYLLVRLMPDLEEPNRQGLAFTFIKAVLRRHIVLPEVYEVLDKVAHIMVCNHTAGVRAAARSAYFMYLMEYEHGEQKLQKAFKFLLDNLSYPTEDGRLSVMDFMHTLVTHASPVLLDQLSVSFFVGLAHVLVADDVRRCRELAAAVLALVFRKSAQSTMLQSMEDFCHAWLTNASNPMLRRCGLMVYKVYVGEFSCGHNAKLDASAYALVARTICAARNERSTRDASPEASDASWEDVYTAMSVWAALCKDNEDAMLCQKQQDVWKDVLDTLLYPHTWVRLVSSRLACVLLSNMDRAGLALSPEQIQTVAYRLLRQLAAPAVTADLGTQIVKNLVHIVTRWEREQTPLLEARNDAESEGENGNTAANVSNGDADEADGDGGGVGPRYACATDFVIDRVCRVMRHEWRSQNASVALTSAIQMTAMFSQLLSVERLITVADKIIMGLYTIVETRGTTDAASEVVALGTECLKLLEQKLGTTAYMEVYTQVQLEVTQRREQRRAKKALLALNDPEEAAKQRMRKNQREKLKKKRERESGNGHYKSRKKRLAASVD